MEVSVYLCKSELALWSLEFS